MKKDQFLDLLDQRLLDIDMAVTELKMAPEVVLTRHHEDGKWSILENLEHLHRYNEFYLPVFLKAIGAAPNSDSQMMKRGRFGVKSAKSMLPDETGVNNPMKTFKSKNPLNSKVDMAIFDVFKKEQNQLKQLLAEARKRDIGAVRCKTTLPFIRFRLCDALEFVINHELRHIAQAGRALSARQ